MSLGCPIFCQFYYLPDKNNCLIANSQNKEGDVQITIVQYNNSNSFVKK